MNHAEALFLRERAWMAHAAGETARAEGEEFHASPAWSPLESGHEASCEIKDGKMYLRVRHRWGAAKHLYETALKPFLTFLDEHHADVLIEGGDKDPWVTYSTWYAKFPDAVLRPGPPHPPQPVHTVRGPARNRRANREVRG